MNRYNWRNSTTSIFDEIRAKLAFKTIETDWLYTSDPIVVLISTNSLFHSPLSGDLKMQSLMSTIKTYVKGPISVLFAAHMHAQQNSDSEILINRYEKYFEGCKIISWDSHVNHKLHIQQLLLKDLHFQMLFEQDVQISYTKDRRALCPDRELYRLDLIDHNAGFLTLAAMGYRYLFYPGKANSSTLYLLNQLPKEQTLSWINVFLSIEKKTKLLYVCQYGKDSY